MPPFHCWWCSPPGVARVGRCSACPAPRPCRSSCSHVPRRVSGSRPPTGISPSPPRSGIVLYLGARTHRISRARAGSSHRHARPVRAPRSSMGRCANGRGVPHSAHAPADRSTRPHQSPTATDTARTTVRPRLDTSAPRRTPRRAAPSSLAHAMPRALGSAQLYNQLVIPRFPCRSRAGGTPTPLRRLPQVPGPDGSTPRAMWCIRGLE